MAQTASGLTQDQVNQADEDRTKRAFVGFLSSALGVDQTYSTDDSNPASQTGQYIIANPDGTYSQIGQARSNLNSSSLAAGGVSPMLILLAVGAYLLLKKGA